MTTDEDHEKAVGLIATAGVTSMNAIEYDALVEEIADGLVAERAKALAPLLALADELEAWPSSRCMRPHNAAERIRAAAGPDRTAGEETP